MTTLIPVIVELLRLLSWYLWITTGQEWSRTFVGMSCVDYQSLNLGTVKSTYHVPLIPELLIRVCKGRMFTNLGLRNAYHLIQISDGEEFKTPFRTRYGQFVDQVMLFLSSNAAALFQAYIDGCLRPNIGDFTVCHLDHKLLNSTREKSPEDQVGKVLQSFEDIR